MWDLTGRKVAPLGDVRVVLSLSSLVVSSANEPRSAEAAEDRTHRPEDRVPEADHQKAGRSRMRFTPSTANHPSLVSKYARAPTRTNRPLGVEACCLITGALSSPSSGSVPAAQMQPASKATKGQNEASRSSPVRPSLQRMPKQSCGIRFGRASSSFPPNQVRRMSR